MKFKDERKIKSNRRISFLFRPMLVYRSIDYPPFRRRHKLYHQEHVQHDNDHLLLVLVDTVYHRSVISTREDEG